jgi:CspA family cold shock protein
MPHIPASALFARVSVRDGVFVHISAVERAGLRGLNDGQKISYDIEQGREGKTSAVNLRAS